MSIMKVIYWSFLLIGWLHNVIYTFTGKEQYLIFASLYFCISACVAKPPE